MLCRAMSKPTEQLLLDAQRVLLYLHRHRHLGLRFEADHLPLRGQCDSDWGVKHSTSGWQFTYSAALISWGSKKQNSVAERANAIVQDGARSLLMSAGLPPQYWVFAVPYFCLCFNAQPGEDGESPWKARFGEPFTSPLYPLDQQSDTCLRLTRGSSSPRPARERELGSIWAMFTMRGAALAPTIG